MTVLFAILAFFVSIYAFVLWVGVKGMKLGAKYINDPEIMPDDEDFQKLKEAMEKQEGRELTREEVLEKLKDMLKEIETKIQPRLNATLAVVGLLIFCAFLF